MKISKFKLVVWLALIALFYACKKEDETAQTVVQRQIIGKWYLKFNIQTIYNNGVEFRLRSDTLIKYNPVDTIVFNQEGVMIRRNKIVLSSVPYSISADGESITYGTSPSTTKKITFISPSRLGFADETVSGSIRTLTEDHLLRY